jgi:hypothetical protein
MRATSGEGLQTALGRRETDLYPFFDPRQPSILLLQQGTNDLGPGSLATGSYLYAVLTTFVAFAHAIKQGRLAKAAAAGLPSMQIRSHRNGAAYRTRTCDPRITNAMLYQLS